MMSNDAMDVDQLARYLRRDAREVGKLADRGDLPGRKVGGAWRFARAEVQHWLEKQLHTFSESQLKAVEDDHPEPTEPLLTSLLHPDSVAVPLPASTRSSVFRGLVKLAEQSWHVYDADAVLTAIQAREELVSTAQDNGVAVLHPRRPLPAALGESLVAFGHTVRGIPFGAPGDGLTDLFFLVCCRDDRTHLRVLARLARLFQKPGFLDRLRSAESSAEALRILRDGEAELIAADAAA
jgi:PTS system nitrogen regulatory IIA component